MNVNVNELKSWIGNEEIIFDEVTKSLETRFRATLDIDPGNPENGEIASSGLHWALGPAVVKSSLLGKDSHPKKGDFLPPVPLPRRMWAGCRTHFFHSLKTYIFYSPELHDSFCRIINPCNLEIFD